MVIGACSREMGLPVRATILSSITSCSTPLKRSITWLEETLSADWSRSKRCRTAAYKRYTRRRIWRTTIAPFLNPEQMDRYILPYIRKMAEKLKEMGMDVMLHTDDDLAPIL